MARPIRIEFEGALYHVTSRGDRREAIYEDDGDRARFLELLGEVAGGFNWVVHAYCLMSNHYHLLIETPDGNLSKGMRQLNGVFTQYSNRRHRRTGHLFQGRYKAILVDADSYLLELARYVVLNPVRAGMVADAGDWPWSSYGAMVGAQASPDWLATDGLLSAFANTRNAARRRYMQFVAAGVGAEPIWKHLNRQVYLGSDAFVQRMQDKAGDADDINVPRAHRRPPPPSLEALAAAYPDRDAAMLAAHRTGEYSYSEIARHFGVHFTTVGRVVRGTPRGQATRSLATAANPERISLAAQAQSEDQCKSIGSKGTGRLPGAAQGMEKSRREDPPPGAVTTTDANPAECDWVQINAW